MNILTYIKNRWWMILLCIICIGLGAVDMVTADSVAEGAPGMVVMSLFTVVAFSESQNLAGARGNLAGVPDQHVKVYGNFIYIPSYNHLIGGVACIGATGEEARIVSPSLRTVNPFYIVPVRGAIESQGNDDVSIDPNVDLVLVENEGIECEIINTPGGVEQDSVLVFLAPSAITPVSGNIYTIHFSINVALVAGEWAFTTITFDDELPNGNYTIVGAHFIIDDAVAARFVFVGGTYRPGCPTVDADSDLTQNKFRRGRFGDWGQFHTTQPPGVEVLSSAAAVAADYDCYMDVVPS